MRRYSVPCRAARAIFDPCSFSRFPKKGNFEEILVDRFLLAVKRFCSPLYCFFISFRASFYRPLFCLTIVALGEFPRFRRRETSRSCQDSRPFFQIYPLDHFIHALARLDFDQMVTVSHDKLFPETRVKCRKMQK